MRMAGYSSSVTATPASSGSSRRFRRNPPIRSAIGLPPRRPPVIAAGMIGSRQGWVEVPYVTCPAGLAGIAAGSAVPAGGAARCGSFPACSGRARRGFPDVMRGEETQILGDLAASHVPGALLRPPGHAQQVGMVRGRPAGALRNLHDRRAVRRPGRDSILGRLMGGRSRRERLRRRARALRPLGRRAPGELLHDLFSTRTLGLTGALKPAALASYLSGLLIGAEVAAAAARPQPRSSCWAAAASRTLCPPCDTACLRGPWRDRRRRAGTPRDRPVSRTDREDDHA